MTTSVQIECPECRHKWFVEKPRPKKRSGGITRTSADARFSTMIRERAHWTCERCGRFMEHDPEHLDCAHMFGRGTGRTRFDRDNAVALCRPGCHDYLDSHPNEKEAFFREVLGDERFDALAARAHGRRDR